MKTTDNKTQETNNNTPIDMERFKGVLKKSDRLLQCLRKANAEIGKLIEENYYLKEHIVSKWSEEDEKLLKFSLENLTELKDKFGKGYGRVGDCIDWLKSLKDRYTWKPSDEQFEMLENVRKILHTNKDIYSKANNLMFNFEELIRTLKKLKD
jgi:hypothetical protein